MWRKLAATSLTLTSLTAYNGDECRLHRLIDGDPLTEYCSDLGPIQWVKVDMGTNTLEVGWVSSSFLFSL